MTEPAPEPEVVIGVSELEDAELGDVNLDGLDDPRNPGDLEVDEDDNRDWKAQFAHDPAAPARDWDAAKRLYIEGVKHPDRHEWPTLQEVADRLGIPGNRMRERSAAQGWRAERTQYQHQIEQTRRQARANAMVQEAVNMDNNALRVAKTGLTLVHAKLVEIGQAAQAARAGGQGSGGVIDALEQTRLAQAADLWHKIGLRAVGDPETHRLEITGANGAPIEISAELRRDDPQRITNVLAVLTGVGLEGLLGGPDDARRALEASRGGDGPES